MPSARGAEGDAGPLRPPDHASDDPGNSTAHIGLADADVTMFGSMQIGRVNLLDWKLVGYAYDPTGAPILVGNLVPAPGALALLGLAAIGARRRVR